MFATIRRYQGPPGQTDETIRRVLHGLVPILGKGRGFVSYQPIDAGNDVAMSVSVHGVRAAADSAHQPAAACGRDNLARLAGPTDVAPAQV